MNHRILDIGETVHPGDEWYDERDETWNKTTADSWGESVHEGFTVRRLEK
jgi:hypothetical protein